TKEVFQMNIGLRSILKLDALVTGANGAAYLVAAGLLDSVLGLPASFLRPVGAFLVVFAIVVWMVARQPVLDGTAVAAVVAANVLWVVDSLALVAFGWFSPSALGEVWIVLQALVVAAFAVLQARGRTARAPVAGAAAEAR
ncbi:MAG TPA: hypothetical protein VGJ32_04335, partial [Solirubrobacteraceae bacterium]